MLITIHPSAEGRRLKSPNVALTPRAERTRRETSEPFDTHWFMSIEIRLIARYSL